MTNPLNYWQNQIINILGQYIMRYFIFDSHGNPAGNPNGYKSHANAWVQAAKLFDHMRSNYSIKLLSI
jgi:hypothetical protein